VAPQPPGGWTTRNLTLTHCEAGGGTSGRWELVGWYPPGVMAPSPVPIDPLPWFPIRSSVMDRVAARPVRATLSQGDSLPVPVVVRHLVKSVGGGAGPLTDVVHQWGLFPALDLSASVLVVAVGSVPGLGVRRLTWLELTSLWDVPILISDQLSETSDVDLLRGFCSSAPSKVLFVGVDLLLTTSFRGGSSSSPSFSSPFAAGGDTPAPKVLTLKAFKSVGPAPKSDGTLGLVAKPMGGGPDYTNIQVIKGDTQKADRAAVPDHLWVHAFLCGYGGENHGPRHLRALGLALHCGVGSLANPSPPDGWELTA
jgi:hypothetical protein